MSEPLWVSRNAVVILHSETVARDGGLVGIRDENLLLSALARPRNAWHYGVTEIEELAAAYACGIAQNHPFLDGNKRAAFLACLLFLRKNGFRLDAKPAEATELFVNLAAGDLSEEELAAWIKSKLIAS